MKRFKVGVGKRAEAGGAYQGSRGGKLVCVAAMLLASVLLVLASAFLPLTVHRQSDLAQVRLGLPLEFVVQDQSRLTPPLAYLPYRTSLSSPWEFPTRIMWAQLLLNMVIVFGLLCLLAVVSGTIVRYVGRRRGRGELS